MICAPAKLVASETVHHDDEEEEMEMYRKNPTVLPGAHQLFSYVPLLSGKRVAIVGNQTSVVENTHLVDTLISLHVNLVKVFSPEHGFRGEGDAGALINDDEDKKTGLKVVSLYGEKKKPTPEQLDSIDVLLFDLQDVGARFYTYISTLHYIMEAAAENNIPVIILDRPNPNAHIIDGPVKKPGFESFISMHPVPVLYGMTIGEYGQMINGQKWLKDSIQCNLQVIPIMNYRHKTPYSLPIAPSPNLKTDNAIVLYPSLCFFEGTTVSVGRGTEMPFEIYGHPEMTEESFKFTPVPMKGATDPKLKNQSCFGLDLRDHNKKFRTLSLTYLLHARDVLYEKYGEKWVDRPRFFNLLAGNDELFIQLNSFCSEEEIRASWEEDIKAFKKVRRNYLIYD